MQEVENVRVVVRIKPLSQEEIEDGVQDITKVQGQVLSLIPPSNIENAEDEMEIIAATPMTPKSNKCGPPVTPKTPKTKSISSSEKLKKFAFDKIYHPLTTQEEVFRDVESFVEAAVNGYNSTIFAYGQTGSGKTYTMTGPLNNPGLIPRVVKKMFQLIDDKPDTLFVIQCSYVELYLDKFVDLLDPNNEPAKKRKQLPNAKPPKIEIHEDTRTKTVFLTGSESLRTTVTTFEKAMELIKRGSQIRTTAATSILIDSKDNKVSGNAAPVHLGKLHLVDLAGSERLSRSGAEGINQKEAQNINSSLTSLGDVLAALSSKHYNGPIPYRNSKLTRLLQDSLGGNSKTFFIVNIDPATHNYQETMMSLMYGQRAKKIKNITTLNKDIMGESDLEKLHLEIEELRRRLLDRTKEFERIREQGASTSEENKQLKQKLLLLSQLNQDEIKNLETQMNDVIHSQHSSLAEMRYEYTALQLHVDDYLTQIRQLKLQIALQDDEKELLQKRLTETLQQLAEMEDQKRSLEQQLNSMQKQKENHKSEVHQQHLVQVNKLQQELKEKEVEIEALKHDIKQQRSAFEAENAKLKQELEAANQSVKALEESMAEKNKAPQPPQEEQPKPKKSKKSKEMKKSEPIPTEQEPDTVSSSKKSREKRKKSQKREEEEAEKEKEHSDEVQQPKKKAKSSKKTSEPTVEEEPAAASEPVKQKRHSSKLAPPDVSPIVNKVTSPSTVLQDVSKQKTANSKATDVSITGKRKLFNASSNTSFMSESTMTNTSTSSNIRGPTATAKSQLRSLFSSGSLVIPKLKISALGGKKSTSNKENETNV